MVVCLRPSEKVCFQTASSFLSPALTFQHEKKYRPFIVKPVLDEPRDFWAA
ncbi:hypothetical protein [Neisseria dumasiana]|uniref:hypothetical protein n=1 Tax=Neisseria dumasiana TaxID=1931275 RepID=UPI001301BFD4|nr:hypothetical protein [Neisseria dumasiana]